MRRRDSGFALLLIFLMAAVMAVTMYMALPRAAFEAEREKEQTLIDRGSQYKRAIQLYVRQNKRWPAKIEDLEDTNGKRYLRRRYQDPMTGKDEWRLVHVGPNGVLTDSLVTPVKKDKDSFNNTFITELGGVQSMPDGSGNAGNPGLRKRPSDQIPSGPPSGGPPSGVPPSDGSGGQAGAPTDGSPPAPALPGSGPATLAGGNPANGMQPGLPRGGQLQGGLSANNGASSGNTFGGISVLGGVGGGYSTAPGANGPAQPPGTISQQGINPANPGQAGANGTTPTNAAALIQGLLTTPRPGGAPGNAGGTGMVQGGGIAGVASKYEGDAIKIYNDQTVYQKWEFVYDMSKDAMITGGAQAVATTANQNQNNANGQSTTGFSTGSSFGSNNTSTSNPAAGSSATTTGH